MILTRARERSRRTPNGPAPRERQALCRAHRNVGIAKGVALVLGESIGGDAPAPALRLMLASVYIGAALVGFAIACYMLPWPLALFGF